MSKKIPTYKLLLVGDGAVGKTAFVKRHRTGEYDARYNATMGVEVHPLKFHTTKGPIIFNVWDCAGQEKFGGLRDGYFIQGQCAIVMFDCQSLLTLMNTQNWQRDILRLIEDAPMVLVGNKQDLSGNILKNTYVPTRSQRQGYLEYCPVSAKTNGGYEKPFLALIKHFLGKDTEIVKK